MKYKTFCCGEIIESKHRHDMKWCKCGKSFVDGGDVYSRLGAKEGIKFPEAIEELPKGGER